MSEEAYREMRALLFGQSPYERDSAPEPELLIDLAPELDTSLLPYAFRTIRDIAFMGRADRYRGLLRLLERAGVDDPEWLSRFGRSLWQYPDFATEISEDLAASAMEALGFVPWHDERRVMVLLTLATRGGSAAGEQAQDALRNELEYLTRALATDPGKSAALLLLLTHPSVVVTDDMRDLLLSSIKGLKDPPKARLFAGLLSHAKEEERALIKEQALAAARRIGSDGTRAMVLLTLSDQLARSERRALLKEAIAVARQMETGDPTRMGIFAELVLRAPEGDRPRLIEIAAQPHKEKGARTGPVEIVAEAFASIAENVPAFLEGVMREQVGMLEIPQHALGDLAPFLSAEQMITALDYSMAALDTPFGPDAHLLSRLAPHLPEELLSVAVTRAGDVPSHREDLQAKMILTLSHSLTSRVALEAVAVAQKMESLWWRGRTLGALLPRLPELYRVELLPLTERVSPERMCTLLGGLAFGDHTELLTQAMDTIWNFYGGGPPPEEGAEAVELEEGEVPLERAATLTQPPAGVSESDLRGTGSDADLSAATEPSAAELPSKGTEPPVEAVVTAGFASQKDPASPLPDDMPLKRSTDYFFWLELGGPGSEADGQSPQPAHAEEALEASRLRVAVFPFDGAVHVEGDSPWGEVKLMNNGAFVVARQPASLPEGLKESGLAKRRIFFPVRTPKRAGTYALRCSIYSKQLLTQSRTVRVRVMAAPKKTKGALRYPLDYNLTRSPGPGLPAGAPYRLSVLVHDNGDSTLSLHLVGEGDFVHRSQFGAQELQHITGQLRGALHKAAWGDEKDWKKRKAFRYGDALDLDQLGKDLARLAVRGCLLFSRCFHSETGNPWLERLQEQVRFPGLIHVAFKEPEHLWMPVALVYDHPLDTTVPGHKLCTAFIADLEGSGNLEKGPCFQGRCPNYAREDVVCPSGFWGFRHTLVVPLSAGKGGPDATSRISHGDPPEMVAGVFTDFKDLGQHESQLEDMARQRGWNARIGRRRSEVMSWMRDGDPSFVYLYCRGGVQGKHPYIHVGSPAEKAITRDNIRNSRIRWEKNRPLVFINDCHTPPLGPEKFFQLAAAFVRTAYASGVVGTETTVLEPLADLFAQEFVSRLLKGEPVGKAVRASRLALLRNGNPLGLAYIAFALADLRVGREGGDQG